MSEGESHETYAQLINPVPEKVGLVGLDEATCWTGWAYDFAEGQEFDPIALFKNREHAAAFVAFLASEYCPEELRSNADAAIMPAHVPQIVVANHMDDKEGAEVLGILCGVGADAWIGEDAACS